MVSEDSPNKPLWKSLAVVILAFWLSASLLIDFVMMPTMYASGMMAEPSFATAGYSMFWVFNRIELLCAAGVLTAVLALWFSQTDADKRAHQSILLSGLLLAFSLIYTYGLTPHMGALGLNLNLFRPIETAPAGMSLLHAGYWLLEMSKLAIVGLLLKWCFRKISLPLSFTNS